MSIIFLDCDMNALDAMPHLIDAGIVKYHLIDSFYKFDEVTMALLPTLTPDDLVIVDAITSLNQTTLTDLKLGTKTDTEGLWRLRDLYYGDKGALMHYNASMDMCMRRLLNIRARARLLTTAHQDEERDPIDMTKKAAPQLSPAFFKAFIRGTTDVFPISVIMEDVLDGEGKMKMPEGTRLLSLRLSPNYVSKTHIPRERAEKLPRAIKDPTLPKLYDVLGKRPSWLAIYGPAGCGKTTFSLTEAEAMFTAAGSPTKTDATTPDTTTKPKPPTAKESNKA